MRRPLNGQARLITVRVHSDSVSEQMRAETARKCAASVVVLGAMLAWPRPIGDRQTGEPRAIAALKTIAMTEIVYASVYGYYDTLECLAKSRCVPGQPADQDPFLSPELLATTNEHGYRIAFFPGPSANDAGVPRRSRSAMNRFAVTAVPVGAASSKLRAFCTDESATIYVVAAGAIPHVADGRCLDVANPLG